MYSVHIVVLLLFCDICVAVRQALMSDLAPIHSRRLEIRHSPFGPGIPLVPDGPCALMPPHTPLKNNRLYVDFYTEYPIHLIEIDGSVTSASKAPVELNIVVDDVSSWNRQFYDKSEYHLTPVVSGREVTVTARAEVSICWVEVFTCRPGRYGETCQLDCPEGTYGLACHEKCYCPNGVNCNHVTGVCPSGCGKSPQGTPETCRDHLVGIAEEDFYSLTTTPITSIHHGPTQDLRSTEFHEKDQHCIDITSQCETKTFFLQLTTTAPISLYGVELSFTSFYIPAPYSIYVTADGKPCYGATIEDGPLRLGRNLLKCHREDATGRRLRVQFTTHNKTAYMNDDGVGVRVCDVRLLDCMSGFHGSHCRRLCECAGFACNKVTGACPEKRCNGHSRGTFCSAIDVTFNTQLLRKHFETHMLHQTNLLAGDSYTSSSYFDSRLDRYVSWLAVQLDTVYFINGITLIFADRQHHMKRQISIFTDTDLEVSNLDIRQRDAWKGVPCVTPDRGKGHDKVTRHMTCMGLAKTLFIVEASDSTHSELPSVGIKVWVCVDGTFGPECRYNCRCEDPTEVCDKSTGQCLSGCAKGFKGVSCLTPCIEDDPDPMCPTKTCHCWGSHDKECGPVEPICSRGCHDGFLGLACTLPCPKGYFGHNCQYECGNCLYGSGDGENGTCHHTNGTCPHGCAHPAEDGPTCRNYTVPKVRPTPKMPNFPSSRDTRLKRAVEESSFRVIMGLIGVIIACTSIVILVCCSLKCYWDRLSHSKKLNEKRVDLIMRRAMRAQMDNKVQKEHQQFHEEYLKRDMLKNLGHSVDLPPEGGGPKGPKNKAKADAIRKMILEMETQRRMRYLSTPRENDNMDDAEDEEQDPNEKVALWVLNQDFNELIDRRRRRLRDYIGNPLTITESPYRISETSVIRDIHRLYDDLEELAIP